MLFENCILCKIRRNSILITTCIRHNVLVTHAVFHINVCQTDSVTILFFSQKMHTYCDVIVHVQCCYGNNAHDWKRPVAWSKFLKKFLKEFVLTIRWIQIMYQNQGHTAYQLFTLCVLYINKLSNYTNNMYIIFKVEDMLALLIEKSRLCFIPVSTTLAI